MRKIRDIIRNLSKLWFRIAYGTITIREHRIDLFAKISLQSIPFSDPESGNNPDAEAKQKMEYNSEPLEIFRDKIFLEMYNNIRIY